MTMACTALVGAGTVLVVLRHIVQAILGTNGRMNIQGKHCLVTGGSSGIGKEVAKVYTDARILPLLLNWVELRCRVL